MILDKPYSVGHFGEKGQTCVIYSVAVHPDGSRFATGGGDHRVKIWSMEPFRASASEVCENATANASKETGTSFVSASSKPHQVLGDVEVLAVLPQHTGSVQCVRWSHGGRYLASASDDTYVLIWELRPGATSSAPFGTTEAPNVENWARVWGLRGHSMDVLDCAWSPDDSMVASCSIDNTVIVWRMPAEAGADGGHFVGNSAILSPHHILRQHKSFVKGVCWDPMGRFLASIGEDNRLLVWRVGGDWGVEATISTPFSGCEDTLVRRISWSPDGQCLVATNSKDRDVHRAVVLIRGRWEENPTSLVGHSNYTLAASFSPTIYHKPVLTTSSAAQAGASGGSSSTSSTKTPAGGNRAGGDGTNGVSSTSATKGGHQVVAVAGQDRVVTVWLAAANRPVAILREVFDKPPSDLSWGADGYSLLISGHDGTVVILRFTKAELGIPLPEADRRAHFIKTYGTDVSLPGSLALALDGAPALVDNPRQLALERSQMAAKKGAGSTQAASGASARTPTNGRSKTPMAFNRRPAQVESRTKGGKRRIQPTLVSNGGSMPPPPPPALASAGHDPTSQARGSIWGSDDGDLSGYGTVSEGFGPPKASTTSGGDRGESESLRAPAGGASEMECSSSRATSMSGHKRPRLGDGGGGGLHPKPLSVGVRPRDAAVVRLRAAGSSTVPVVSPPDVMPRRGASGSLVRLISYDSVAEAGAFRPASRLRHSGQIATAGQGSRSQELGNRDRSATAGAPVVAEAGYGGHDGHNGWNASASAVLECSSVEEEFRGLPARRYTTVTVTRGGREAWRDYVAGTVSACCGNSRVAAVGVEDGSIYVYDRSGTRSAPPLVVCPPVAYLECNESSPSQGDSQGHPAMVSNDFLMAISGDGDVYVWNLTSMTLATKSSLGALFRSVSCAVSRVSGSSPSSSTAGSPRNSSSSGTGANSTSRTNSVEGITGEGDAGETLGISSTHGSGLRGSSASSGGGTGTGSTGGTGTGTGTGRAGGAGGASVTVARAGVTAEGMPLVMLACPGAFGGSLQAFALHQGLGTWVRVADSRFALSDFYSSGSCTLSSKNGLLAALQARVRSGSAPTPAALLQASRVGSGVTAGRIGLGGAASGARATAAAMTTPSLQRDSLRTAVTRGHLEDSLGTAVLLGSPVEFQDVLKAYAGFLAKNAGSSDGRIRALCDKLLLGSGILKGSSGVSGYQRKASLPKATSSGGILGLGLGRGPSILGIDKLYLLKEMILPILGANRSLQRLVNEYYDAIDLASEALAAPLPPPSSSPERQRVFATRPATPSTNSSVSRVRNGASPTPPDDGGARVSDGSDSRETVQQRHDPVGDNPLEACDIIGDELPSRDPADGTTATTEGWKGRQEKERDRFLGAGSGSTKRTESTAVADIGRSTTAPGRRAGSGTGTGTGSSPVAKTFASNGVCREHVRISNGLRMPPSANTPREVPAMFDAGVSVNRAGLEESGRRPGAEKGGGSRVGPARNDATWTGGGRQLDRNPRESWRDVVSAAGARSGDAFPHR